MIAGAFGALSLDSTRGSHHQVSGSAPWTPATMGTPIRSFLSNDLLKLVFLNFVKLHLSKIS